MAGMLASAHSATLVGLEAFPVRCEVDAGRGVPSFELVGLAEAAVRESRVRVKSALAQIGVDLSEYRIVVNLAPADLRKNGSGFDLAIAAAVLGALGRVEKESLAAAMFIGELSLSGGVQGLRGVLPHVMGAKARGFPRIVVPRVSEAEAACVSGIDVLTCEGLAELLEHLAGRAPLPRAKPGAPESPPAYDDLAELKGQSAARRALEICAAGGHNLLMIGPPGAGKTMLARRLPGILPPLSSDEALEVMTVHSVAGSLRRGTGRLFARPFRAPHHTLSEAALVGGSDPPRPGEVSLAHHGVLFLDELAEFRRSVLEALRQPLEDGVVTVSRAFAKTTFHARPLLVGAMNPCPCGFLGDARRCGCTAERVRTYRSRISGPLLDRIDVHVVLPPVEVGALVARGRGEASEAVRARVIEARERQLARAPHRRATNAALSPADLERVATPDPEGRALLERAASRHMLSARAFGKVMRVARTIADLDGSLEVRGPHVAEAITLRAFDRGGTALAA